MNISKIAVLGSGVMGSAIAANAANAGIPVVLLDIVAPNDANRNALCENALKRMLGASPSPFLSPERAKLVTCGNLEDHLHLLGEADWIIEAVVEKLAIKQEVYRKIDPVRKKGSVVSSNTSTIPLHELLEGLSEKLAQDFMIAHFFNPPRFMRLLEVVKSPAMQQKRFDAVCDFADRMLGKEIVPCKDTPGFIANRIGVYWMNVGLNEALARGISVEEADAVMGRAAGFPKTGIFGLFDLIGLDLMPLIAKEMLSVLPATDPFAALETQPTLMQKLIKEGYTGRKGKGGFYRLRKEGNAKIKEALDLQTGEYRPEARPALASAKAKTLKELLAAGDAGAEYAWAVLARTLHYAASLIPEIADDIAAVDTAMKSGYSWKYGPFELIDAIGMEAFCARLTQDGFSLPPILAAANNRPLYRTHNGRLEQLTLTGDYTAVTRAPGVLLISDIRRAAKPVLETAGAKLWDLGDGIAGFEITTKMSAIDDAVLEALERSLEKVKAEFSGLIIGHDGEPFSAGANLSFFLEKAQGGDFATIEAVIARGQRAFMALKYAPFPSVAALSGMALGGGCEIMLHCSNVQAHAESYPGLVEVNVGLIPAWGGCKEMLLRTQGSGISIQDVFERIFSAKTAGSSDEALALGFLKPGSRITMNRARLLADAKTFCQELAGGYRTPASTRVTLPQDVQLLREKEAENSENRHQIVIGRVLAGVLSGQGEQTLTEQQLLDAEREGFMALIKTPGTHARIEHMLKTGKPLRN